MVPWTQLSHSISISSAVFAQLTRVPNTDTQTTLHATSVAIGLIYALHAGNAVTTRKHRQSYRHADPRRQQQHMAVAVRVNSNRATVTFFVTV